MVSDPAIQAQRHPRHRPPDEDVAARLGHRAVRDARGRCRTGSARRGAEDHHDEDGSQPPHGQSPPAADGKLSKRPPPREGPKKEQAGRGVVIFTDARRTPPRPRSSPGCAGAAVVVAYAGRKEDGRGYPGPATGSSRKGRRVSLFRAGQCPSGRPRQCASAAPCRGHMPRPGHRRSEGPPQPHA